MPDPKRDGRMPLNIEVARNVFKVLGKEVPIRGAVSGPFSLAAHLVGPEHLFMLTMTHPPLVRDLLSFSSEVIKRYGRAFIELGCGVVIFDSQASPDLLSPQMYRDLVLPPTRGVIAHFQQAGAKHVPLVIGGNTTKILDSYLESGANNILCDAKADAKEFLERCSKSGRAFRRNIDSSDFLQAAEDQLRERARKYLEESQGYAGFILGTGVVPYGTPVEKLAAIRETVHSFKVK
jgi:uroporphyrinogen decarboxylase